MDKLVIVSIAVLSLVPQLNSQPVNLDTSKAEPIVSGFFVTRENKFPDRSKEAEVARQVDAQREQARLEAIRQAEIQKQAQVQAQAQSVPNTPVLSSDDAFIQLSYCEAGGKPATNTGNGYYGMFQYDLQTWANYMGYARPDLAPAEVQLAKAKETQARRGWSPWPQCSKKLGLM
jgi:hypothetical protein